MPYKPRVEGQVSRQQRRAQERQHVKELGIQNRFLFLKAQNDKLMRERLEKIKAKQDSVPALPEGGVQ